MLRNAECEWTLVLGVLPYLQVSLSFRASCCCSQWSRCSRVSSNWICELWKITTIPTIRTSIPKQTRNLQRPVRAKRVPLIFLLSSFRIFLSVAVVRVNTPRSKIKFFKYSLPLSYFVRILVIFPFVFFCFLIVYAFDRRAKYLTVLNITADYLQITAQFT